MDSGLIERLSNPTLYPGHLSDIDAALAGMRLSPANKITRRYTMPLKPNAEDCKYAEGEVYQHPRSEALDITTCVGESCPGLFRSHPSED
jgi:hypothetical protein